MMGMFDTIINRYPLPEDFPDFARGDGRRFQTKDLDCELATFEITPDGRLTRTGWGWYGEGTDPLPGAEDYSGDMEIYDANMAACCGGQTYTEDGSDYESVSLRFRFNAGHVASVELIEHIRHPALSMADRREIEGPSPTEVEIERWESRVAESLVGREVFVLWGGSPIESGYPATVVAEGPREWVARKASGGMECLSRALRDRIVFDSRDAAVESRKAQREEHEAQQARYDELMAARTVTGDGAAAISVGGAEDRK
jgi:hypothetical protein